MLATALAAAAAASVATSLATVEKAEDVRAAAMETAALQAVETAL